MKQLKTRLQVVTQNVPEDEPSSVTAEIPTTNSKSIWSEFDTTAKENIIHNLRAAVIAEIYRYLQEPLLTRNENPLIWWLNRNECIQHCMT